MSSLSVSLTQELGLISNILGRFCPSEFYNNMFCLYLPGDIVSVYRKSHLFDVEIPEKGVSLKESAFTIPGHSLSSPVQTPIGNVGHFMLYAGSGFDTNTSHCYCYGGFFSVAVIVVGRLGHLLWSEIPWVITCSAKTWRWYPDLPVSFHCCHRSCSLGGKGGVSAVFCIQHMLLNVTGQTVP